MTDQYRNINVSVGFGITPTVVTGQQYAVMTENNYTRILATFPSTLVSAGYSFLIDVSYTDATNTAQVGTFSLTYDSVTQTYPFQLARTFLYGSKITVQYRALNQVDGQEAIDPSSIIVIVKNAINLVNYEDIDGTPVNSQTVLLQAMVSAHAVITASTTQLGHVEVDGITVQSSNGILSTVSNILSVDGNTIVNSGGVIYAKAASGGGTSSSMPRGFEAYWSGQPTWSNGGSNVNITMDQKTYDPNGIYSGSTGIATIPSGGLYRVTANILCQASGTPNGSAITLYLIENGSTTLSTSVVCPQKVNGTSFTLFIDRNFVLASGTTLQLQEYNGCGVTVYPQNFQVNCYWSVQQLTN